MIKKFLILTIGKNEKPIFKKVKKLEAGRWKMIYVPEGESYWVKDEEVKIKALKREMPASGEDLTVDGYIAKHGGIKSIMTDEVFTSKRSYMDHLKQHNCVIKDW